jgi:hypothetical protein
MIPKPVKIVGNLEKKELEYRIQEKREKDVKKEEKNRG